MMRAVTSVPIQQLESEHLKEYRPPHRKKATLRGMKQAYRELRALKVPAVNSDGEGILDPAGNPVYVAAVRTTADLHRGVISDWMDAHQGRSSVRCESILRNFKVIFNFAVSRDWLEISPFAAKKLRQWVRSDAVPSRNHNRVWDRTPGEIRQYLEYLDEKAPASWAGRRLQFAMYVFVFTAFRDQEVKHLLAHNVDLDRMTVTVEPLAPFWTPKTVPSARTVPMAEPLAEVARLWLPICGSEVLRERTGWDFAVPGAKLVGPWTGGSPGYSLYTQCVAACHAAGIGHVSPIFARIWFGTNGKTMGLGELEVQQFLGHSCPYTQRYYNREKVESLRPAASKLELFYGAAQ